MSTEEITKTSATDVPWFCLTRHAEDPDPDDAGDPAPEEEPNAAAAKPDGEPDSADDIDPDASEGDEPIDGLGDAGKKALDRMKGERAAAKKEAAAAKKQAAETSRLLAEMQQKVDAFEDRDRTDLEKAQAAVERAKTQAAKAVAQAVAGEIKVAATGRFADISDATDVLMGDPSKYVDTDGRIDTSAIESALADLLERKPHWAAPVPAPESEMPKKKRPAADPAQGSRGPVPLTNFLTASDDEVAAELGKYGYRQRSK